jgi:hypothetical protein
MSTARAWGTQGLVSPSTSTQSLETVGYEEIDPMSMATNGRLRGPKVHIHRYDVGIWLLQLALCLWLAGGIAFLACVAVCVFVNIGYVTFSSTGEIIIVVMAFTFYSSCLFTAFRSLVRTWIRLCLCVVRERFGEGERDFILVRWVDSLAHCVADGALCSCSEETRDFWTSVIKTIILLVLLSALFGAPFLYVAFYYGYYAVISVACALLTIGSSCVVLATNILSRTFRSIKFLWSIIFDGEDEGRLKAAYVASTGNDHGRSVMNVLLDRGIITLICVMLCTGVFSQGRASPEIWIFLASTTSVLILLRLRFASKCDSGDEDDIESPWRNHGYYSGRTWKHVILVFVTRNILIALGLSSLYYLDYTRIVGFSGNSVLNGDEIQKYNTSRDVAWILGLFYVTNVLKDILFFIKLPFPLFRCIFLFVSQVALIGLGTYGNFYYYSFALRICFLLSLIELDYREGKLYWKSPSAVRKYTTKQRRAMKNTYLILGMIVLFYTASVVIGLVQGSSQSPRDESLEEIFGNATTHSPNAKRPVFCDVSYNGLSLADLGTMSSAVYQKDPKLVLNKLFINPRLREWQLGSYSLEDRSVRPSNYWSNSSSNGWQTFSGVRYVEFTNFVQGSNMSVVAVRGTNKLEDVFQDIYLWSTIGLLQQSSYFGTLFNAWPLEVAAWTVEMINRIASEPNALYVADMQSIVSEIREHKSERDKNSIILTGHSVRFSNGVAC